MRKGNPSSKGFLIREIFIKQNKLLLLIIMPVPKDS